MDNKTNKQFCVIMFYVLLSVSLILLRSHAPCSLKFLTPFSPLPKPPWRALYMTSTMVPKSTIFIANVRVMKLHTKYSLMCVDYREILTFSLIYHSFSIHQNSLTARGHFRGQGCKHILSFFFAYTGSAGVLKHVKDT